MTFLSLFMRYHLSKENFYTKKAKEEGYPARSVYKLQEIDKKFRLLKAGDRVLDLGASPGSWLLYISQKIGEKGRVIAVDTAELKIDLPANSMFLKKSIFDFNQEDYHPDSSFCHPEGTPEGSHSRDSSLSLRMTELGPAMTGSSPIFSAVVSDLAPKTTGLHEKDVALCLELAERAFLIAQQTLKNNGNFVCKLFAGKDVDDFIKEVKKDFALVKKYRPQAIRRQSREFYLVAKNFIHSNH